LDVKVEAAVGGRDAAADGDVDVDGDGDGDRDGLATGDGTGDGDTGGDVGPSPTVPDGAVSICTPNAPTATVAKAPVTAIRRRCRR
jgi:hypothetical protein